MVEFEKRETTQQTKITIGNKGNSSRILTIIQLHAFRSHCSSESGYKLPWCYLHGSIPGSKIRIQITVILQRDNGYRKRLAALKV